MSKWIKKPHVPHVPRCKCGNPGVKKYFGNSWSCQRCLDLDRFVTEMHNKTRLKQDERYTISFE